MLAIFAVIIGGIVTGRLLVGWRLAFVQRLITFIIWALLFLLGVEVGSDPAVVGSLATLGAAAFAIFALSVAGSVFAAWFLLRREMLVADVPLPEIMRRGKLLQHQFTLFAGFHIVFQETVAI